MAHPAAAPIAISPPTANSHARVGVPKKAHGSDVEVSRSDSTNDSTPNTASTTARLGSSFVRSATRDTISTATTSTSSGHTR
ncbi:unannotated protein [freshwater metagenome]|uniref:Unannotated protein n=1 Tax=freshwater metagenome TaxID=449393 RepID=A0A6J7J2S7_9ZZZZ